MKEFLIGVIGAAVAYSIPLIIVLIDNRFSGKKKRDPKEHVARLLIDRLETVILDRMEKKR